MIHFLLNLAYENIVKWGEMIDNIIQFLPYS